MGEAQNNKTQGISSLPLLFHVKSISKAKTLPFSISRENQKKSKTLLSPSLLHV
jgi:hypothetical protein